jgi:hypothetical protein
MVLPTEVETVSGLGQLQRPCVGHRLPVIGSLPDKAPICSNAPPARRGCKPVVRALVRVYNDLARANTAGSTTEGSTGPVACDKGAGLMVATDVKETRRRLNELAETQHWVHHVADLDSGKILTFPLDRPVTPLSRAERLSRLGHSFDPSIFGGIFGGPSYSLSPNHPHNDSPLAGLSVSGADIFDAFRDQVIWSPPQNANDANFIFRQINFTLTVSPIALSREYQSVRQGLARNGGTPQGVIQKRLSSDSH